VPFIGEGVGVSTPGSRRPAVAFGLGAVLGALTWAAWLGWDRTASYDVVAGTMQKPYVTLQVLGCALTVGLVTAVLAARWHPTAAAIGVTLGFWLVWTLHARAHDASGLYALGSVMLAIGLAAGTTVAAVLGAAVRAAMDAGRRRTRHASGGREGR
jgi:hypothetical protein